MKKWIQKKNKKRGQTLIFIILIFQMLFILMAMMINIGLVVHDKINLQNSVDLAAVYAAQRQAEVLNAMAHVNYQIRQSYKLLAWRYFVLGNIGANEGSGGRRSLSRPINFSNSDAHCPNLGNSGRFGPCPQQETHRVDNAYAVCMVHPYWERNVSQVSDHFCQSRPFTGSGQIQRPKATYHNSVQANNTIVLGGDGLDEVVVDAALRAIDKSCRGNSRLNWFMASFFLHSFRVDQHRRKLLIYQLFKDVLSQNKDIEGKDILEGVSKTIQKNLTSSNFLSFNPINNIDFRTSSEGKDFGEYFEWNQIYPVLFYLFSGENSSNNNGDQRLCDYQLRPTFEPPDGIGPEFDHFLLSSVEAYTNPATDPMHSFYLSSGFYKSSLEEFYITLSAEIENYRNQIFFPGARGLTLKATAYAKPFGALFGPRNDHDPLLPQNNNYTGSISDLLSENLPNHSLFPGDILGLIRGTIQKNWIDHIRPQRGYNGRTFINYSLLLSTIDSLVFSRSSSSQSIEDQNLRSPIRRLEELAIAPDQFDLTYYTILTDYMTTLYPKLRVHLGDDIPGDLGFYEEEKVADIEGNRWVNNVKTWQDLQRDHATYLPSCYGATYGGENFRLNFITGQTQCVAQARRDQIPISYKIGDANHLLTSWHPERESGYRIGACDLRGTHKIEFQDPLFFADDPDKEPYKAIPQGCFTGGRSGFSVKLIHSDMAN